MDTSTVGYEVDFLPVGEGEKSGDAITLRWGCLHADRQRQTVVVIDAGYMANGADVVKHVNTYYKTDTVDLVISTHPHADHIGGLDTVLRELNVRNMAMHRPWAREHTAGIADLFVNGRVTSKSVRDNLKKGLDAAYDLECLVNSRRGSTTLVEPFAGLYLEENGGKLHILGPSKDFYESLLPYFRATPAPKADTRQRSYGATEEYTTRSESQTTETLDDAGETSAENDSGVITALTIGGATLLFTGDAGMTALNRALARMAALGIGTQSITFIQVPHHGSVHNMGPKLLDRLVGPRLPLPQKVKTAFVSIASRTQDIKHPSKRITNAFKRRGAEVYPTAGNVILHSMNAPQRAGWGPVAEIPFHNTVEIYK